MCGKWGVRPDGAADDSIFARARGYGAATIADEFSQQGVIFHPAGKGNRKAGWQRMRTMLSQARSIDYAQSMAVEFVEKGKKALYAFPAGDARDALMFLPDYVLSRDR